MFHAQVPFPRERHKFLCSIRYFFILSLSTPNGSRGGGWDNGVCLNLTVYEIWGVECFVSGHLPSQWCPSVAVVIIHPANDRTWQALYFERMGHV